jgi:hypothetical protein
MKALLQPEKVGLTKSKIDPFLCFQMFQQAKITTSIKKGLLKSCLAAEREA